MLYGPIGLIRCLVRFKVRISALEGLPASVVTRIEQDCLVDFAGRLRTGLFVYPSLLAAIWLATSYRQEHPLILLLVTAVVLTGFTLRLLITRARRVADLRSPEDWFREIAVTVLLLAMPFGVLLAHAIRDYGLSGWNFTILMTWDAGLTAGSIVSFSPNYKLMQLQLYALLVPALAISLFQNDFHCSQYFLGSLAFLTFALLQGKKLHNAYWQQAVSVRLEEYRSEELERARKTADEQRQLAEAAQARAERAARVRTEFLANMSHEIRTPMHAIMGMTTLLLDEKLPAETMEYVSAIRTSSDALLTIINDILDISKLESGKLDLEHETLCLYECVEEVLELLAPQAAEKGIELAADVDYGVSDWIYGDVTRLRQIIVNLVNNGIKFTEHGEVIVEVRTRLDASAGEVLHVAVRDTGIGIPADKLDRLFQAFSQADASTTRRFGGTGLGLSISKRLVDLMGGRIWVESEPGVGSTFQFTIPYEPAEGKRTPSLVSGSWKGKTALIVDDSSTNRIILSAYLARWGIVTQTAATAHEALLALRGVAAHWDILLIDYAMPGVDGVHLTRTIQTEFGEAAPPIVILSSGATNAREAFGAESNPADAFLVKPIRRSHLHRVLEQIFSNAQGVYGAPGASIIDPEFATLRPLRILLAEDNQVNQKMVLRLLERFGYRPDAVNNGLEVLNALRRQRYDLVLMDIQMPEMDGLAATRRIREEWTGEERPWVTALTAGAMKGDRDVCLAAGVDDYLTKPINIRSLEKALARCYAEISKRAASRESATLACR